jgi:hypothetical protein
MPSNPPVIVFSACQAERQHKKTACAATDTIGRVRVFFDTG